MRIVFMGTPDFSVPCLSELVGVGHDVACVYTQPPRAAGRGQKERLSPVHAFAEQAGIPVVTTPTLKDPHEQRGFAAIGADVAVVIAYGLILPGEVLQAPKHGCLNLHASLLPRWRGAAPIQRAIMAGDAETGVMVMQMDEGLDTGPVCLGDRTSIGADETAGELHDRLSRLGADLMVRALAALERGSLDCKEQEEEGVTYAAKIEKAEARIDWNSPASDLHNMIRGLSPFPGAWFELEVNGKSERIKVLRSSLTDGAGTPGKVLDDALTVACGSGSVQLTRLQRAGKKPMLAGEFLRGVPVVSGTTLS
ncbi:MAG: methionyl-tRNA formyltransferase [Hyphomicrobiaceae bacterium]|nr:methionyl-tRNA formyltransferase [Hyphomicrobiaceae bacterium]